MAFYTLGTQYYSFDKPGPTTTNTSSGTSVTQNQSADLGLVRSVVGDVLANKAKGIEYDAAEAGQNMQAAGYDAEISSYGSTEKIANMYAAYSGAIGDIHTIQAQREALSAAGTQRAAMGSSGIGDSSDIVRQTLQRGYLQEQIVRTQANFDQTGYLEQASAARAQSSAAGVAKDAALNTAAIYGSAADQARTYAANETTGLSGYLSKFSLQNTTAQGLLSGQDVGTELATAPKVVSTTNDQTSTSATVQPKLTPGMGWNSDGSYQSAGVAPMNDPSIGSTNALPKLTPKV